MKPFLTSCAAAASLSLLASCANTGFIGHRLGYDVNAELKPDMSAPVAFNAGFESHTSVAMPPRKSLSMNDLRNSLKLPKGEVLSSVNRLEIQRIQPSAGTNDTGVELDFVTVTATGAAADAATGPKGQTGETIQKSSQTPNSLEVSQITKIATDPASTRQGEEL